MSQEPPNPSDPESQAPPLPPPLPTPAPVPPRPWGFFATLGWATLIAIAYLIVEVILLVALAFAMHLDFQSIESDGKALALCTLAGAPVVAGSCIGIAWLRKGIKVRDYLALRWPSKRVVSRWCVIAIAFAAASDAVTSLLGRLIVPPFMTEAYESAGALRPFLWLALMVGAPLGEEFFFRGFLFAGIRDSRLGPIAAVLITALSWAAIHVQYDLYGISSILLLGLILGFAREKTNSLYLCMLLHSITNLIASIEVITYETMVRM